MKFRITGKKSLVSHGSVPKQIKETDSLDSHTRKRVAAKYKQHACKEAHSAADLVLACEEVECLFGADEESDSRGEKDVSECQERRIKEKDYTKHQE